MLRALRIQWCSEQGAEALQVVEQDVGAEGSDAVYDARCPRGAVPPAPTSDSGCAAALDFHKKNGKKLNRIEEKDESEPEPPSRKRKSSLKGAPPALLEPY